jgi:hypothetical protein
MQSLLNIAVPQEKLLQLLNNIWRKHQIPTYVKTGTVIIIHKAQRKIIVMITGAIDRIHVLSK